MKKKCFHEGIIQAYVDGELAPDLSRSVLRHAATCDACAGLLTKAEDESALVFTALEQELGVFVPTERLREKVFASIREIERKKQRSIWQKLSESLAFLDFDFGSPIVVALSCTIMFAGTFVVAMKFYPRMPSLNEVAVDGGQLVPMPMVVTGPNVSDESQEKNGLRPDVPIERIAKIRKSHRNSRRNRNYTYINAVNRQGPKTPKGPAIEGEDSYLQTIAALGNDFKENKDDILAPGERVAFEKDLAIVNDAIMRLRAEVGKNPNNIAAKRILKATYQSKIDLLNSVVEKNELMASMQ